ncbi:hypothetical protein Rsub_11041 [Raphidocelis subcapitata]|uniref:Uncharacterized protein n=1 Tax=Raphidocelis subcapitata TaxID=307507 RepID=A0A2V0PED5_9CHLO|nr:hypothetical protein Rsub_11041 [Raphidocelis subcapitata]|eukprot:GBF98221.1 hypothetical protein Rsub_11041 [Raphidocelis subcapitata]
MASESEEDSGSPPSSPPRPKRDWTKTELEALLDAWVTDPQTAWRLSDLSGLGSGGRMSAAARAMQAQLLGEIDNCSADELAEGLEMTLLTSYGIWETVQLPKLVAGLEAAPFDRFDPLPVQWKAVDAACRAAVRRTRAPAHPLDTACAMLWFQREVPVWGTDAMACDGCGEPKRWWQGGWVCRSCDDDDTFRPPKRRRTRRAMVAVPAAVLPAVPAVPAAPAVPAVVAATPSAAGAGGASGPAPPLPGRAAAHLPSAAGPGPHGNPAGGLARGPDGAAPAESAHAAPPTTAAAGPQPATAEPPGSAAGAEEPRAAGARPALCELDELFAEWLK